MQLPCSGVAALWPLSWDGGEVTFHPCPQHPGPPFAGAGAVGQEVGARLARSLCGSPACTLEGSVEPLAGLVLCPEHCTSLQIPRLDGEYDLKLPRDMAYVFSGAYVPLSCKIIEQVSSTCVS